MWEHPFSLTREGLGSLLAYATSRVDRRTRTRTDLCRCSFVTSARAPTLCVRRGRPSTSSTRKFFAPIVKQPSLLIHTYRKPLTNGTVHAFDASISQDDVKHIPKHTTDGIAYAETLHGCLDRGMASPDTLPAAAQRLRDMAVTNVPTDATVTGLTTSIRAHVTRVTSTPAAALKMPVKKAMACGCAGNCADDCDCCEECECKESCRECEVEEVEVEEFDDDEEDVEEFEVEVDDRMRGRGRATKSRRPIARAKIPTSTVNTFHRRLAALTLEERAEVLGGRVQF